MLDAHLIELQQEFKQINVRDNAQLRAWLLQNKHVPTSDLAQVAGVRTSMIRVWKVKVGIPSKKMRFKPKVVLPTIKSIVIPENWKTKEWLEENIKLHTVKGLSKLLNIPRRTLRDYLKRFGIKTPSLAESTRSKNKFCTYDWCYHHYVEQGLTLEACAKKAGITRSGFENWLNKFKIRYRTNKPKQIWAKKLYHDFRKHPIVKKIKVYDKHWKIWLKDRTSRILYLEPACGVIFTTKELAAFDTVPAINYEYEADLVDGNQYAGHFGIDIKQWRKSSQLEKLLASHTFAKRMKDNWIWPKYPTHVLEHHLQSCHELPLDLYHKYNEFSMAPRAKVKFVPGPALSIHFFDFSEYKWIYKFPRLTLRLIKQLSEHDRKINVQNLICTSHTTGLVPRICYPTHYISFFKQYKVKGSVLDLSPGFGTRAIACAVAGLKYYALPHTSMTKAVDQGFAEFIKLDYEPYAGQTVDWLIYDNNFWPVNMATAFMYANKAKRMMVFVPEAQTDEIFSEFPTDTKIVVPYNMQRHHWCIY